MSAFRKAVSGAAVVSVLTIAGLGLNSMEASAQDAGAEEAVDPSVEPQGTPVTTIATTTTVAKTTTTATGGNLGSVGAATTVAGATTTVAGTTTTKAPVPGAGAITTTATKVEAANESQLPVTGSDVGAPIKLGVALGALGVGALLIARRRRPSAA